MQRSRLTIVGITTMTFFGLALHASADEPYKLQKTVKVGGAGGFDYVYADVDGRRLYIPRPGATGAGALSVFAGA